MDPQFVSAWSVLPFGFRRAPDFILVEVYRCFGFRTEGKNRSELIANLDQCAFGPTEFEQLACFVNPDYEGAWKIAELKRKFRKILTFFEDPVLPKNFILGYPRPGRGNVYTPLQIFCFAQEHGFFFSLDSTIDQMCRLISYALKETEPPFRHDLGFKLAQSLRQARLLELVSNPSLKKPNHFTSYLLEKFYFYNRRYEIEYLSFLELAEKFNPTQAFEQLKPTTVDDFIDEVVILSVPREYYQLDFLDTFGDDYQKESLMNHFYLGKDFRKVVNTETPILMEDVSSLTEPISYGVPGQKMTVFSIEEVYQTIRRKRVFYTPDNRKLRPQAVDRLIKITHDYPRLKELCLEIKQEQATGGEVAELLQYLTPDLKPEVTQSFQWLLEAGMYMRGWDGTGGSSNYPMRSGQPHAETHHLVSVALTRLINHAHPLALNSPIVRRDDGEYIYEIVNNAKQTVIERIQLLIGKPDSVSSCIRVASNWFVGTAHRYLSALLDQPLPFDLDQVSYFS